jgi:hypothetical protein
MQVTPELELGPTLEIVFDPVRDPDKDIVIVWGLRARIAL